jgi:hypothetical protein
MAWLHLICVAVFRRRVIIRIHSPLCRKRIRRRHLVLVIRYLGGHGGAHGVRTIIAGRQRVAAVNRVWVLSSPLRVVYLLTEHIAAMIGITGHSCVRVKPRGLPTLHVRGTSHGPQRLHVFIDHDCGIRFWRRCWTTTPCTDGVSTSLSPCLRYRREVLPICCPRYQYP